jgi:hypothetical protein
LSLVELADAIVRIDLHQLALFGQRIARVLAIELLELLDSGLVILAIHVVQRALVERGGGDNRRFLELGSAEQVHARASGESNSEQTYGGETGCPVRHLAYNFNSHELPRSQTSTSACGVISNWIKTVAQAPAEAGQRTDLR